MPPTFVSAEECASLLSADDVVAEVRRALERERRGTIAWPEPRNLNLIGDAHGNHYHVKACVLEDVPIAGIRVVSHPGADDSGGGTRLIVLVDPETTRTVAIVDESWNYGQRTVASIAVAVAAVARDDAETLAVVGSGHLARLALPYCRGLLPALTDVRVCSRTPERREAFAAWARTEHGLDAAAFGSVEDAVAEADVVLTATSAARPLVEEEWIAPGTVVAALDPAELSPALVRASDLLLVDSREQLAKELARCYGPDVEPHATFAEVLAGEHPGRTHASQRVAIVSQGLASQDVALAHLAYLRARMPAAAPVTRASRSDGA